MVAGSCSPRERLIVALDFPSATSALAHVDRLEGRCRWFKVGLELFLAEGHSIVERLASRGFKVFLDLKLHDIPNTIAGAIRSVADSGAALLTVHASGGPAMLHAAQQTAALHGGDLRLLAVTVLTSMDSAELQAVGIRSEPAEQVQTLARLATDAGLAGVVCSPAEAALLRSGLGPQPLLVVPGIRPAGAERGDQRRTATPLEAIAAGASMLVVGRPITQAEDPANAVDAILAEIGETSATANGKGEEAGGTLPSQLIP